MATPLLTGLDHVALVVRDLDRAADECAALLGVVYNWRGADGGVEQAWFQLQNTALDVIAPVGAGPMGDWARAHLDANGEGLWALAFATPDIARAQRLLTQRGAKTSAPRQISTAHVNTHEKRYWTTASVDAAASYGPMVMLVEQEDGAAAWPRSEATADACVVGLDHVVVRSPDPDRAAAFYGARLGLDMRLDRAAPEWGARLMFFRCGDIIVEIAHDLKAGRGDGPDALYGLSWRVQNADLARARLADAGLDVSEVRAGRKPGTRVFTVRNKSAGVPTLIVEPAA